MPRSPRSSSIGASPSSSDHASSELPPPKTHWTTEHRTNMAAIVGGAVADAPRAPPRIQRYQHFTSEHDFVTVHLAGGRQRVALRPHQQDSPLASPRSSSYEIAGKSVVQPRAASPHSRVTLESESREISFEQPSMSMRDGAEVMTLDGHSYGESSHSEYTASGIGSRDASELSLGEGSSDIPPAFALMEKSLVAIPQKTSWDESTWKAGIKARGRDGMGATATPAGQWRGYFAEHKSCGSSGSATTPVHPAAAYKEGYTGHQSTRTPMNARVMQLSSPALTAMWNPKSVEALAPLAPTNVITPSNAKTLSQSHNIRPPPSGNGQLLPQG
ncbi:MAG: hypothetical protein SGPRY_003569 [Prymnesium sp.]